MAIWIWAFVGGIVGTFIMDLGAGFLGKRGMDTALGGLLGRWVTGFGKAQFVIDGNRELEMPETPSEARVGFLFHFIVGGGGVALLYPLWFAVSDMALPGNHIVGGAVFGLLSVSLTWFLQYPCFGFSWFGRNAPAGSNTIVAPALLHTAYGAGVGLVLHFSLG